jgi:hypothetical protein
MTGLLFLLLILVKGDNLLGSWQLLMGEIRDISNDDGTANTIPTVAGAAIAKDMHTYLEEQGNSQSI